MSSAPALRRATTDDGVAAFTLVAAVLREFNLAADADATDADLRDLERHYFSRGGDFVVLVDERGSIVGTCGLYPLGDGVVELRKMYLSRALRGMGQGRRLMQWALSRARELGFRRMTLETATVLKDAIALYERHGFRRDPGGVHSCRCDSAYAREL